MKPIVEQLESRDCPSTITPSWAPPNPGIPAAYPTFPAPPAGCQVITMYDIFNNIPLIPGNGVQGFLTPAVPVSDRSGTRVLVDLRPAIGHAVGQDFDSWGNPYFFVPNQYLPAGFLHGPEAQQQTAMVQSLAAARVPVQQVDYAGIVAALMVGKKP